MSKHTPKPWNIKAHESMRHAKKRSREERVREKIVSIIDYHKFLFSEFDQLKLRSEDYDFIESIYTKTVQHQVDYEDFLDSRPPLEKSYRYTKWLKAKDRRDP